MHNYKPVVERCRDTQLYVGYVPGFPARTAELRPAVSLMRIFAKSSRCFLR
jgi:hypothetical protein